MNKIFALFLVAALLFAAGCSSVPDNKLLEQAAVTYAVSKVIEKNPAYAPRIVAIAQAVEDATNGDTVNTVALLDGFIKSKINWTKLSPADTALVNVLLEEVVLQLQARVGNGVLASDKLIVVREVAEWIKVAARLSSSTASPSALPAPASGG